MLRNSWFVSLIRPIAWIVFLYPVMVGFYLGASKDILLSSIVFGFGALFFVLCFGFSVNALSDVDVDMYHDGRSKDMNLSRQPLVTGEISILQGKLFCLLFLVGSLLCALVVGFYFMLTIIVLDVIGYVYSLEPFRMKKRPIGDVMCNALSGVFFFLAGMTIGNASVNPLLLVTVFLMASNFYITTVMTDYEFDKKAGLRTSAVVYGGKRLLVGMYVLTAIICILGVVLIWSASFEVQIIAVMITIYTPIFTRIVKNRLWGNQLMLHRNWILVPFGCLTFVFFCLGVFKIVA
jgi:lycopene elongase/hydratase (dihydrobisanhydrobacterioruberin-forming)